MYLCRRHLCLQPRSHSGPPALPYLIQEMHWRRDTPNSIFTNQIQCDLEENISDYVTSRVCWLHSHRLGSQRSFIDLFEKRVYLGQI